jgi:hypothetical protein
VAGLRAGCAVARILARFLRVARVGSPFWDALRGRTTVQPAMQIPAPIGGAERRSEQRRRALMTGKIVHSGGCGSFDCTLRDLSDHGAQVSVRGDQQLPADCYLIVVRTGQAHPAQLAWRRGERMGLKFGDAIDLNTPATAHPGLRNLWIELSPR